MSQETVEKKTGVFEFQFPLLLVRTKRGLGLLERIGQWRATRWLGWLVLAIMPLIAAIGLYVILQTVSVIISNAMARSYVRSITPLANLLIPGLNPYLPIVYGWVALVIGLVAHEAAHGVLARSLKFPVKSAGLLLLIIIPIGAFVEVDDKELRKGRSKDSGRVLAAGPGMNVVVAVASLAALLLVLGSVAPVVSGVGVTIVVKDYPVDKAGILPGDIIYGINGKPVSSVEQTVQALGDMKPGDNITLDVAKILDRTTISKQTYVVEAVESPIEKGKGYMGFHGVGLQDSLEDYRSFGRVSPFVYLVWPTLSSSNQEIIPFSDTMQKFYTSSFGPQFVIIANIFFWIWFINFNLAIFNALPIYPLDGGQAFRTLVQAVVGKSIGEKMVFRVTLSVTLVVVGLVISMLFFPYLF